MSELDWTSALSKFDDLQMLAGKVEQIAKAATSDMNSRNAAVNRIDLENGSDSDSDGDYGSSLSEYAFEDIIEDLSAYMESLADLSSSLDRPAMDRVLVEDAPTSLDDEFATV